MDSFHLVLYCRYNDNRVPVTLTKRMCFADVLHIICQRFNLSMDVVSLSYIGMREERCYLRDDNEMNDMVCLFSVLGTKLVEVIVSDGSVVLWNGLKSKDVSGGSSKDVSGSSSVVVDEHDTEDCDPLEYCDADSSLVRKVYKTTEWVGCITGVGQVFMGGVTEFRDALRKHCILTGRDCYSEKNMKNKVKAFCRERDNGCNWSIVASIKAPDHMFMIRSFYSKHTCAGLGPTDSNKQLSSKLLAGLVKEFVDNDDSFTPIALITRMRLDYGIEVSYYKAWNAIQIAKGEHVGDDGQSYKNLERYLEALQTTNPGSRVVLEVVNDGIQSKRFKRLFVAFSACIEGFKHVRPLLFIDGTFLKGKFRGTLLSAVGKNGNKGLFPVAFAFVDAENTDNWEWFLNELSNTVGNAHRLTFFSDRHKGLLEDMARVFPNSVHSFCLQHLKDNLKTRFSGGGVFFAKKRNHLVKLLKECAIAPTIPLFEEKLKKLSKIGGRKMDDFINSIEVEKWTEAYCGVCRYGETTSNAVESFNSWILDLRELPITEMLDKLRLNLMKWFDDRKTKSAKWKSILCKHYDKVWSTSLHNILSWLVVRSTRFKFEVLSDPSESVDLEKRECSFHKWKTHGFPCNHVVLCIVREKLSVKDYVEHWFHAETYRKSYELSINPVPTSLWCDSELPNDSNMKPTDVRSQPGRRKRKRIPSKGEVVSNKKRAIRCGRCKKLVTISVHARKKFHLSN